MTPSNKVQIACRAGFGVLTSLALGACTITQTIHPADVAAGSEVCVIQNKDVRENFSDAICTALTNHGYHPRKLPAASSPSECPVSLTYEANWRWDLAMYLAFARLQVYRDGKQTGDALYDSLAGGGNLSKFISADQKVEELVGKLLPKR